jgi:two-component system response regulator FixJ
VGAPRVIIVDDDEAVRDSLKLLLECCGLAVEDYGSIDEFALQYRPGGASCIILDQHLPGLTGLNFLSSDAGAKLGLPVIVLTGHADSALRARAAQLGVRVLLEKPVIEDVLLDAIRRALGDQAATIAETATTGALEENCATSTN